MKRRKKVCVCGGEGDAGGDKGGKKRGERGQREEGREEWGEEKGGEMGKWGEQMNGNVDQDIYLLSLSSFKFKQRSQEQA